MEFCRERIDSDSPIDFEIAFKSTLSGGAFRMVGRAALASSTSVSAFLTASDAISYCQTGAGLDAAPGTIITGWF
jgi:hypothetical protein